MWEDGSSWFTKKHISRGFSGTQRMWVALALLSRHVITIIVEWKQKVNRRKSHSHKSGSMVTSGYEDKIFDWTWICEVIFIFPPQTCPHSNCHLHVSQSRKLVGVESISIHRHDGITWRYQKSLDVRQILSWLKSTCPDVCETNIVVDLSWNWKYARFVMGSLVSKINKLNLDSSF